MPARPGCVVWDDHETANDAWAGGAENHPAGQRGRLERRARRRGAGAFRLDAYPRSGVTAGFSINRRLRVRRLGVPSQLETRLTTRDHHSHLQRDLPALGVLGGQVAAFRAGAVGSVTQMMSRALAWLRDGCCFVRSGGRGRCFWETMVMGPRDRPPIRQMLGSRRLRQCARLRPGTRDRLETDAAALALGCRLGWTT